MVKKLSKRALMDIVIGAGFLGTGGGGAIPSGNQLVEDQLKEVEIIPVSEVEDNANIVVAAGMGSPEILLEKGWGNQTVNAFEAIERVLGKEFDYVIPIETGSFNSLTPMTITNKKGIPTIDADGAGRAIPELQQTMYSLKEIPISPTALADDENTWAVFNTDDPFKMEDITRAVVSQIGGIAGIVLHPMTGKQMKESVIKNTITLSQKVGAAIRKAKETGEDPVDSVLDVINGYELIQGEIVEKTTETKGGFDFGKVTIEGRGKYVDDTLVVDYKNENMLAKKNGNIITMVPDRICWITTDGDPLTNTDVKEGLKVAAIGIKAPKRWRTKKGFTAFKRVLESLGYEGDYKKIEDLV